MVIDCQHHGVFPKLAKLRSLYAETANTMLKKGGLSATTLRRRLCDLCMQLDDYFSD